MSDVLELKKTVKQLQSAANDQVCLSRAISVYPSCPLIGFFLSSQEVIAILETLKHKHVTEAILRVGVAPRFSAFAA